LRLMISYKTAGVWTKRGLKGFVPARAGEFPTGREKQWARRDLSKLSFLTPGSAR
jgi:hypothetical protein